MVVGLDLNEINSLRPKMCINLIRSLTFFFVNNLNMNLLTWTWIIGDMMYVFANIPKGTISSGITLMLRLNPYYFIVSKNDQFTIHFPFILNQFLIDYVHSFQNFGLVFGSFISTHRNIFLVSQIYFHLLQ